MVKSVKQVGFSVSAIIVFIIMIFPLIYMTSFSLRPEVEVYKYPFTLIPHKITFANYRTILIARNFGIYLLNTFLVAGVASAVSIMIGTLACYSITRFKFPGRNFIIPLVLFSYMLPPIVLIIPFYVVWNSVGLTDTRIGLTLTYISLTFPFSVLLLRSFFENTPKVLEEAAIVDGATKFQAFYKVTLPLVFPGMISVFIFVFILAWNDYLYASVLISSDLKQTVSLGLGILIGKTTIYSWVVLLAGGVITTLPVLLIFTLMQSKLVPGISVGAVKG